MSFQYLSPDNCQLQPNRIDIWEFSLEILPSGAKLLLSEDELNRARRFYFPHHQRRFIVARAMLRVILARYLQLDAASLAFTYSKHGKPRIENPVGLEFNLSHSGDIALLAIGQESPLGVDIEFFSSRPYAGIASHSFSSNETDTFSNLPKYLKPLAFFHVWAQKEALIKACGLGLSYPTRQFDVPVVPPTHDLVDDTLHRKQWRITSFMPRVACSAALCHTDAIQKIYYVPVDPVILIK
ncbi:MULTISPECIES: 4'-phosphopantetheinyl transferase superfamily protein [unclassified Legionella]|uniref:4'-phosphopantetheinyl transferase family protein n=1 Tax=unclassified Legionella TaxID=2622702 RepID=UPI0010546ED0|nr:MULTISPECIES: 4'-phosphopantetheinyl transferase superfamily protein [unclassified Legionella]MDI9817783.1 4'-phosphopantetheinyl transferase superfamily protein [Legionella sp. PL877]